VIKKINSLTVILRSLEENCAIRLSKPDFSINLRDFRLGVEKTPLLKLQKNRDGWNSVYDLRNVSLHWVKGWQLRSGLITNLIRLILWNVLDDQTLNKELESINKRPIDILNILGAITHLSCENYFDKHQILTAGLMTKDSTESFVRKIFKF